MNHFPDAKVILSRREAGKWFESVNATILKPEVNEVVATTPWAPCSSPTSGVSSATGSPTAIT